MHKSVLALMALGFIAGAAHAADGQPPAGPAAPAACSSFKEFVSTDCPLTWNGITLYGAYDIGLGWVSHGLPENGYFVHRL